MKRKPYVVASNGINDQWKAAVKEFNSLVKKKPRTMSDAIIRRLNILTALHRLTMIAELEPDLREFIRDCWPADLFRK